MSITTEHITYTIDGQTYDGFLAKPESPGPLPLVVIAHAWGGLQDNEISKANLVAEKLGYAAFAMDVYGKGRRGDGPAECEALMTPLVNDRAELQARLNGSLAFAKQLPGIDVTRVAAIGYCFGGLSVLDMARMNMDILGVCSFHGLLGAPDNAGSAPIKPKILIQHGWKDPMAPPDTVIAIGEELGARGADWQLHAHGTAVHAFTTQGANMPDFGTVYEATADTRSFKALENFLAELFA